MSPVKSSLKKKFKEDLPESETDTSLKSEIKEKMLGKRHKEPIFNSSPKKVRIIEDKSTKKTTMGL